MSFVFKWVVNAFSKSYKASVAKRLYAYGLKHDDLLIENADVVKAISRTNKTAILERERRIKRAFDISGKKKTIPEEYHNYDAFDLYLSKHVQGAHKERVERILLDH